MSLRTLLLSLRRPPSTPTLHDHEKALVYDPPTQPPPPSCTTLSLRPLLISTATALLLFFTCWTSTSSPSSSSIFRSHQGPYLQPTQLIDVDNISYFPDPPSPPLSSSNKHIQPALLNITHTTPPQHTQSQLWFTAEYMIEYPECGGGVVCDGVQGRESLKLGLCGEEDDLGAGNDEAEGKWDWRFPESENDAVWGVRRRPLENWTKVTGVDRADTSIRTVALYSQTRQNTQWRVILSTAGVLINAQAWDYHREKVMRVINVNGSRKKVPMVTFKGRYGACPWDETEGRAVVVEDQGEE